MGAKEATHCSIRVFAPSLIEAGERDSKKTCMVVRLKKLFFPKAICVENVLEGWLMVRLNMN